MTKNHLNNSSQNYLVAQGNESYDILIHALTHEDNKENIDRHILILEKWLRENNEG
jgi:hypothetical protein